MVRVMHIVIATAEPRAAYHLLPLAKALKESQNTFVHLVPYPEPVQGEAIMDVTSQLSVIKDCDRVVVTGGPLSAWTELVCRYASTLGKPVIYTQLANVANTSPVAPRVSTALATALSMDGVDAVSRYLQMSDVSVTGTPALDELPAWNPVPKQALLLSMSEMTRRDPSLQLLAAAVLLRRHGWDVRVRTHPREDRTPWDAFDVINGETQVESASSAQVVIGYPGSAHVLAAAVGVPVIALSPNEALASVFTERQSAAMSAHAQSATEVISLVDSVRPPDRSLVEVVVGPLGDASRRIVDLWTGPLLDMSS